MGARSATPLLVSIIWEPNKSKPKCLVTFCSVAGKVEVYTFDIEIPPFYDVVDGQFADSSDLDTAIQAEAGKFKREKLNVFFWLICNKLPCPYFRVDE